MALRTYKVDFLYYTNTPRIEMSEHIVADSVKEAYDFFKNSISPKFENNVTLTSLHATDIPWA
jgi:hypothetical protein